MDAKGAVSGDAGAGLRDRVRGHVLACWAPGADYAEILQIESGLLRLQDQEQQRWPWE